MGKLKISKSEDKRKRLSVWEHYLAKEIGIEFKACLYFFCILFFDSMYKLCNGIYEVSIIHLAEMIFATYIMGYVQVYLLSNFDEGENLRARELCCMTACALVYAGVSCLCGWFDRNAAVTVGFFVYIMAVYLCAFLVYKSKRGVDEKLLNEELKAFQERRESDGECN